MTQSRYIELKSKTIGELSQDSTVSESDIRFIIENLKKDISDIEFDQETEDIYEKHNYFYEGKFHNGWKLVIDGCLFNFEIKNGDLISEELYIDAYPFWRGVSMVQNKDRKWNLLKNDGTYLSDMWFDRFKYHAYSKNSWIVGYNKGIYDDKGNEVGHHFPFPDHENLLDNGGWNCDRYYKHNYYYNDKGDRLEGDFEVWSDFSDGIALVRKKVGGSGYFVFNYLKTDGSFLFDEWYDSISGYSHDWFLVRRRSDMLYTFVNKNGEYLFPGKWFYNACPFRKYTAYIQEKPDGMTKWIDSDGRIIGQVTFII